MSIDFSKHWVEQQPCNIRCNITKPVEADCHDHDMSLIQKYFMVFITSDFLQISRYVKGRLNKNTVVLVTVPRDTKS